MNTYPEFRFFLIVITLLIACSLQAESISIKATLIVGSNNGSQIQPQLKEYEKNLKHLFKYTSYKLEGQGNTLIELPNSNNIRLNQTHSLQLSAEKANNDKIKLNVHWKDGNKALINTTLVVRSGQPTILGGPPTPDKSGNLILVLIPR